MFQAADTATTESVPVQEPVATADAETYLPDKPQAAEIAAPLARTVDSDASGFETQPADKQDQPHSAPLRAEPDVFSRLGAIDVRPAAQLAASLSSADAAINAAAWRRIARDLPVRLDDYLDSGMDVAVAFWNPNPGMKLSHASLPVVAAVGVADVGPYRLRQFEGLKEGLASIA
jgi:hypothetical protein